MATPRDNNYIRGNNYIGNFIGDYISNGSLAAISPITGPYLLADGTDYLLADSTPMLLA